MYSPRLQCHSHYHVRECKFSEEHLFCSLPTQLVTQEARAPHQKSPASKKGWAWVSALMGDLQRKSPGPLRSADTACSSNVMFGNTVLPEMFFQIRCESNNGHERSPSAFHNSYWVNLNFLVKLNLENCLIHHQLQLDTVFPFTSCPTYLVPRE